jgi:hypothetical protein
MRFARSIFPVIFFTVASLIYVHQQVELVKLSYSIEKKEKKLNEMLDRNDQLSYNIKNLESPSRLERVLVSKNINVTFPKRGHVLNMAKPVIVYRAQDIRQVGLKRKVNIFGFLDFFTSRAEAQAKE